MSGLVKVIIVAVLVFGGLAIWKYSSSPTTSVTSQDPLLEVRANDWVRGDAHAPVTLVEYTDFQCPACGAYYPVVEQLLKDMEGKLKVVIRHYPLLQVHPNALPAARAAEAAGRQGKFFEMYDLLFGNQQEWSTAADPSKSIFPSYAGKIGLDIEKFRSDLADSTIDSAINADRESGNSLNIEGTPTFFLNGEKIANPKSAEEFKSLVEAAAKKAPVVQSDATAAAEIHEHADFKVYLAGQAVDFSQAKYQSSEEAGGKELDASVHLHDGNGEIIHKHQTGVTMGRFFQSLGIAFSKECFQLDGGEKFCNGNGKTLQLFVNGQPNTSFDAYEIQDLDRILVTYGASDEKTIESQIASVGDSACIYSETCPERGKPPTEGCVGGLGTGCKDGQ